MRPLEIGHETRYGLGPRAVRARRSPRGRDASTQGPSRHAGSRRRVPGKITRPDQVAEYLRRRIRDDAREHFVAIYLDGRHRPIADSVVSIGTATASLVHPREVFQPAIALGACALLIAHNHPRGDVTPSAEDLDLTRRLADAGRLLGVTLLDHVVWEREGAFHSIRETHPDHLSPAA